MRKELAKRKNRFGMGIYFGEAHISSALFCASANGEPMANGWPPNYVYCCESMTLAKTEKKRKLSWTTENVAQLNAYCFSARMRREKPLRYENATRHILSTHPKPILVAPHSFSGSSSLPLLPPHLLPGQIIRI